MKRVHTDLIRERSANEDGLTLIECLVAVVVIAITTAAIAPMLVFSVATRVQNQKAEQALQLAQAEVDKIRLEVEQGGDYGDRLLNLSLFSTTSTNPVTVPAPTSFIASTTAVGDWKEARKIDFDGDGDDDFAIQIFRTPGVEVEPDLGGSVKTPVVFDMGVRVYDARAEANIGKLSTDEAGLTFTSGDGDRSRQPLAVLYSQISQGDRRGGLCQYWEFTSSTPGVMPVDLVCN